MCLLSSEGFVENTCLISESIITPNKCWCDEFVFVKQHIIHPFIHNLWCFVVCYYYLFWFLTFSLYPKWKLANSSQYLRMWRIMVLSLSVTCFWLTIVGTNSRLPEVALNIKGVFDDRAAMLFPRRPLWLHMNDMISRLPMDCQASENHHYHRNTVTKGLSIPQNLPWYSACTISLSGYSADTLSSNRAFL